MRQLETKRMTLQVALLIASMSSLLIYIGEGQEFDRTWFVRFLEGCAGVQNINLDGMIGALVTASFSYSHDSTNLSAAA